MKKSFKDFLNAREQLTTRCLSEPHMKISYVAKKYAKITMHGETQNIKPKDVIVVEWNFDLQGNAIGIAEICINSIVVENDKSIAQMKKWLGTNTVLNKDNWFI